MKPLKKLTHHAKKSLREAENIARSLKENVVEPKHLLLAVYLQKGSLGSAFLHDLGIGEEVINSLFLKDGKADKENGIHPIPLSDTSKRIIVKAFSFASKSHSPYVGTEHIARALLEFPDTEIRLLVDQSQKKKKTPQTVQNPKGSFRFILPDISALFGNHEGLNSKQNNEEEDGDTIEQFCIDLNRRAKEENGDVFIGRQKEINRLINVLGRKTKNNAVLIGDPGVGKTAIVAGLAARIERGDVPPFLLDKTIYELDMALVVAGTTFRGEFEARLKDILQVAKEDPKIILFIDEIHTIVGSGNTNGSLDAANILKPALSRAELQCIGATTFPEYKKYFEKDAALERRFQPIRVPEPSQTETRQILDGISESFERHHNARILPEALDAAVELGAHHIHDRFFPDKAIDILDEAASQKRNSRKSPSNRLRIQKIERQIDTLTGTKQNLIQQEKYDDAQSTQEKIVLLEKELQLLHKKEVAIRKRNTVVLEKKDVEKTVAFMAGVAVEKIAQNNRMRMGELESKMKLSIVGQDNAIKRITATLERSYAGLGDNNRPLGSFLLLGPTGVGKTHSAQVLADLLFEGCNSLIRVNMSEFQERHTISALIGSPAGYIGYGEGGKFTEKVRRNPHSVILLDEIDKAHPDVLNILLQILEDGELTDAEGRKVSFAHAVIILTSNIGSAETVRARHSFGFKNINTTNDTINFSKIFHSSAINDVRKGMRPEILSRLDDIIVFSPLGKRDIQKIVTLHIKKTQEKLKLQGIHLILDTNAMKVLVEKSFRGGDGARSVRKHVREEMETVLARQILANTPSTSKSTKTFLLKAKNNKLFVELSR